MYIVSGLDGDETSPVVSITTIGANVANAVKNLVGGGNRYYVFVSIPFSFVNGINVDFEGASTASNTLSVNSANIIAMLESPPLDKISAV